MKGIVLFFGILTSVRGMQVPRSILTSVRGMQVPRRYPDQCQVFVVEKVTLWNGLIYLTFGTETDEGVAKDQVFAQTEKRTRHFQNKAQYAIRKAITIVQGPVRYPQSYHYTPRPSTLSAKLSLQSKAQYAIRKAITILQGDDEQGNVQSTWLNAIRFWVQVLAKNRTRVEKDSKLLPDQNEPQLQDSPQLPFKIAILSI